MTTWFLNNQTRLRDERIAINELQARSPWLENIEWSLDDQIKMCVIFDIHLEYGVFNLKLTYHNTFPYTAPSIAPVDPSRLSEHQYGNGDLCLEIRPDNWRSEFTGANMIVSAFNLLDKERPDTDGVVTTAPSAHDLPETISMRRARSRFYLSSEQLRILRDEAPELASIKIWDQWSSGSFYVAHISEIWKDDWIWKNTSLPPALGREARVKNGFLVKTNKVAAELDGVVGIQDLIDVVGVNPTQGESSFFFLVVFSKEPPALFEQANGVEKLFRYRSVIAPHEKTHRTGAQKEELAGLRVGVVGLGSLGSKVALNLARAGVGRFDLVDDDILHPGNLERHDGDWRDIGLHKVDLVKRRLELVSVDVRVTARRVSIGAQVSAIEAGNVDGALSECDLIVDATANPNVLNHLSSIVSGAGNVLVWGSVYAGGIGGFIARSRPGKDPDPHLVRQALNDYYENVESPPPVPDGAGYDGRDSDEVLIASDVDVSLIAGHMSAYSIDCLLKTEPSNFEAPIYLIGLKRAWEFEVPFQVISIPVDAPPSKPSSDGELYPEQAEFIGVLLEKKRNEN